MTTTPTRGPTQAEIREVLRPFAEPADTMDEDALPDRYRIWAAKDGAGEDVHVLRVENFRAARDLLARLDAPAPGVSPLDGMDAWGGVPDGIRERLAAAPQPSPAPGGWQMVPVEPTEEMLAAADSAIPRAEADLNGSRMMGREVALECWQAMLAALVPQPEAKEGGDAQRSPRTATCNDAPGEHPGAGADVERAWQEWLSNAAQDEDVDRASFFAGYRAAIAALGQEVKTPTSADEAELMEKLGYDYLKRNAPERLAALDQRSEREIIERCAKVAEEWADTNSTIPYELSDAIRALAGEPG